MSVQGFTPPRSTASASDGATSSSHQPPQKSLRALEAADGAESSPRVLNSSTDEEDAKERGEHALPVPACPELSPRGVGPETLAQPVPHAPLQEEEAEGEESHDADNFVPRKNRTETLEQNVAEPFQTKSEACTEMVEIGSDKGDEAKAGPGKEEAKADEGLEAPASTAATDQVGPQPSALSPESSAFAPCVNSSARASSYPPSRSDEKGWDTPFKQNKSK